VRKRAEVDPVLPDIPVVRQCELLDLSRSTFYYLPTPDERLNQELMRRLDEEYTKHPFFGSRKLTVRLRKAGFAVNRKRIQGLMRRMGLEAIYRKPRLSLPGRQNKRYPYLRKGITIARPDQAWCADITYIRLAHGFVYLVAILDWHSRHVPAWSLSTPLEKEFCLEALRDSLRISRPEIFNTDQGAQFTSPEFTGLLERAGIRISMDGRGRVYDNIFVERFWRSAKYEEVYLHEYRTVAEARAHLGAYFRFYNEERPHEAIGYRTPHEVYFGSSAAMASAVEVVV
jgi:putative transposase